MEMVGAVRICDCSHMEKGEGFNNLCLHNFSRERSHHNSVSSVSTEGDGDDDDVDQEPPSGGMLPLSLLVQCRRSYVVIVWNRDGWKEGGRGEMRQKEPQDAIVDMHNFILSVATFNSPMYRARKNGWLAPASVLLWLQTIFSAPVRHHV